MTTPRNEIPASHPYRSDAALRNRYEGKPNFALRRAMLGAGLAAVAVLGVFGVKQGVETIHQNNVAASVSHPFPEVAADLKAGDIDSGDVAKVTIPKTELAWTAASELAADGQPVQELSDIIQDQRGDQLYKGEKVILPAQTVDPQQIEPPK